MTVEIISWSISTKVWYRAGIELTTPGSVVRHASVARHVTDCATRPGTGHVAYQIKRESRMQQHGSKYFACRFPRPRGWGQIIKNSTFSELGHVEYQIKWNHECSNMVANMFACRPPCPPLRSKGQNFTFSRT